MSKITTTDLLYLLEHPNALRKEEYTLLTRLSKEYPYFHTPQMLLLKYLKANHDGTYQKELIHCLPLFTNRRKLFDYLNHYSIEFEKDMIQEVETETTLKENNARREPDSLRAGISEMLARQKGDIKKPLISEDHIFPEVRFEWEEKINSRKNGKTDVEPMVPEIIETPDSNEEAIILIEDTPPVTSSKPDKTTVDKLINSFITNEPRIVPRMEPNTQENIAELSLNEHDDLITETLVTIYLKQGLYDKAIMAYEKLILKFPEKSTYFAARILEIKQLTDKKE